MKPRNSSPFRSHASITAAFSVALFSHFAAPSALAATLFWSGDGSSQGGVGTWNTTLARFGTVAAGPYTTVWNNTTNATDTVNFNSATGTITLGSNVTVGGIQAFTGSTGNTIAGGTGPFTITLGNATTIFTNAANATTSRTFVVNAVVTGSNNLSIVGPATTPGGSITLGGVNTYTGTTTVNNTTLTIGAAGQLNSGNYAGAISLANVSGSNFLTYSSSLNQTLSGNITGNGKLTKGTSASSILILSGASNTYSGGTAVNLGTLTFQKTTAKPASGTVTVAAAATLGLGVAASGSFFTSADVDSLFAGTLSGVTNDATSNVGIDTTQGDFTHATSVGVSTRGLVKLGANILTLSGTNAYTGATNIKTGTILMSGGGTLGTGAALTLSGGNLDLGTTSQTVGAVDVTTPAASSIIFNGSLAGTSYAASNTTGDAIISANLLVNGAAGFTKTGAGTASLSGTNTYTGGTAVNVGALTFLNTGAKPASGTVTVAAGATLGLGVATAGSFFTSADVDSLFAGTLSGVTNDATSYAGIDTTQGDFTYATSVSGSPTRGLAKLGANTLTLTGSNTFTGGVSITTGTLLLGNTGALNSTAGSENAVTFGAGTTGTLALAGNSVVISNLTGSAVGPVVTNANGSAVSNATLTVGNSLNLGGTYTGILQDGTGGGALALTKAGTGVLVLSGINTYTGVTNINAGAIRITNASALGTTGGNTVVASGGELVVNTALTVAEAFNIAGLGLAGSTGALHTGGNVTSTFTGAITLSANSGFQGDGGTTTTLSGGIDTAGFSFTNNGSGNVTVSTVGISGVGGSLIKNTGGTLTLGAANTFTGSTTINAGVLSLGNVNALQNTSGITVGGATAATLQNSGDTTGITISVPITAANSGVASTIAFGRNTAAQGSMTLSGGITGGAGNVTFTTTSGNSGGNVQTIVLGGGVGSAGGYGGSTTISCNTNNAITLRAGIANALPTTTVLTFAQSLGTGTGRASTFDLFGNNQTLAGLSNTGNVPDSRNMTVTSTAAATLTINGTSNLTFGGRSTIGGVTAQARITGAISLVKNGAGTFTLGGTLVGGAGAIGNTFTGSTQILGGILVLGESLSIQNSAFDTTNSIAGDATNGLQTTVTTLTLGGLSGNKNLASVFETTAGGYSGVTALTLNPGTGATPSYSAIIADGAAGMTLTKSGAGTQTLSGANSYTGATTVTAGTLALGASNVLPDTAVSIGNATLDAATFSDTLGTLDVTSTAKINLGAGATLAFATGSPAWTGTLTITGTFVSGASLKFGNDASGLSALQLAAISKPGFTAFALNGSGFLTATAGGYSSWQAANGPTTQTIDLDHDLDGVSNGAEYFLGGSTNTTGFTALPGVTNTAGTLSVTWTKGATYLGVYGTDFWVETSATLTGVWTAAALGAGANQVDITTVPGDVKYTFPAGTTNFARLKVTGP